MRILALAYACEPHKGSEPGAGWTWVRMIASLGDVWVVTRANNRPAIEAELACVPEADRLHFAYVDLPPWARTWKRGSRGLRLYYLLWQAAALREGRRLHARWRFDLVWHLTFATAWLGSSGPLVGPPFVFGPVGGGVVTPWRLMPSLGVRGAAHDLLRRAGRLAGRYLNPLARLAWGRAGLVLAQNPETLAWLPRRHRPKTYVVPNALSEREGASGGRRAWGSTPTAVFAGRLVAWKGASLAIRAVGLLPDWTLVVCGAGPDEPRLRSLAGRLASGRVQFRGWVDKEELFRIMREEADVFLFPSLHDDSPLAVVEAAACGLPVVALDRGGPPLLGAHVVAVATTRKVAGALASTLRRMPLALKDAPTRAARLLDVRERLAAAGYVARSDGEGE